MSIPEACSLILEASALAENTRIFVFDMGEEHKIVDLAERMIRLAGMEPYEDIDITFTGLSQARSYTKRSWPRRRIQSKPIYPKYT